MYSLHQCYLLFINMHTGNVSYPKIKEFFLHLEARVIRFDVTDVSVFFGILLLIKSWNLWSVNDSCQLTLEYFAKCKVWKCPAWKWSWYNEWKESGHAALDRSMLKIQRTNSMNYLCKAQRKCSHANVPTSLRP
jgi:hypothetical protein